MRNIRAIWREMTFWIKMVHILSAFTNYAATAVEETLIANVPSSKLTDKISKKSKR